MTATTIDGTYRLTPAQQAMLLHHLYAPQSGAFVQQVVGSIRRDLHIGAFERAWRIVVQRHPVLRCAFRWEGLEEPVLDAHRDVGVRLEQHDWRGLDERGRRYRLEMFLQSDRRRGFALVEAPLMRLTLCRLAEDLYQFVWTSHGLLDATSRQFVLQEVALAYEAYRRGDEPDLAPLAEEPHRDWLRRSDPVTSETFWRSYLHGFGAPTPLVVSRPPGQVLISEETYDARDLHLSDDAEAGLRDIEERHGVTRLAIVRGAWAILLSRYSGESDIVAGEIRSSGRSGGGAGRPPLGFFFNTIPVRVRVRPELPLGEWLESLEADDASLAPHVSTPPGLVRGCCDVPRHLPIFETVLALEEGTGDAELRSLLAARWGCDDLEVLEQTNQPITLFGRVEPRISLRLSYNRHHFADAAIDRMLGHLRTLLEGMALRSDVDVRRLPMLTEGERRQVLVEWNDTVREYESEASVHELVAAHARRTPDAVAVICGDDQLTYAELDARAVRLARRIRRLGIDPGARVALCVERSVEMAVGVLGILKSGSAYVPLDPRYPPERNAATIADARVAAIIAERGTAEALPGGSARVLLLDAPADDEGMEEVAPVSTSPDDLAYVIYTSGSTGRPKGVMITHGNLTHYVQAIPQALGVRADDRYLHTASIAFSSSVRQLFVPLSLGATVVIATRSDIGDPVALFELVNRSGATIADLVPSYWRSCIQVLEALEPERLGSILDNRLRLVLSASEALPADVPRRWKSVLRHGARLINMYGQTETTGIVGVFPIPDECLEAGDVVAVGRPLPNTRLYVLDESLEPVPVGVPGDIFAAGRGIGVGYLGQPALTAERFVSDPFSATPGARMYRTGDRGRLLTDGSIAFMGRGDDQAKIRGFRVEMGDVEIALRRVPGVREALVVARDDGTGERRLAAYIVADPQAAPRGADVRAALQRVLPDYMLPSALVRIEALPRTPNGKIDRAALPEPNFSRDDLGTEYVAPRTSTEALLADLWSEMLGVERVGREDGFFALGGHSLIGMRLIARLRALFGVEIPLRALFETPHLAEFAARLDSARDTRIPGDPYPILRGGSSEEMPLSFAQERLWVLHQMEPASAAYNLSAAMRLDGALRIGLLEEVLGEIVRRHEPLRTIFPSVDGTVRQRVLPATGIALPVEDMRRVPEAERGAAVDRRLAEEASRPFDLERGPVMRALLLRVEDEAFVLLLTMHHIASDGWSRGVLYEEIGALYAAYAQDRPSPLAEPSIRYVDYAGWQREWLASGVLDAQIAYWRERLDGAPTVDIPTDRPRPLVQSFRGATRTFAIPAPVVASLRALGVQEGATLYMTLLAALQTMLARYSGQENVVVGSPIAGRTRPETESLIGFFVNTLAMRADLSGNPSFRSLLGRVRDTALGAFANQDLPFERLVDALHLPRDLGRSPLFQVMFVLQNTQLHPLELPGLTVRTIEVDSGAAKFDLTLSVVPSEEGHVGRFEYNADLFDVESVDRMIGHYLTLLDGIATHPDQSIWQLPLLTGAESTQLTSNWNATTTQTAEARGVHELIEEQARRRPQSVAIAFEDRELTYRELNERANQVARHLRELGAGPDTLVGICLERSLEMMVGLLGILKSGAAYVPLDPTYPKDRLAFMLEDSAVPVLLTQQRLVRRLPPTAANVVRLDADWEEIARKSREAPRVAIGEDALAYVIYTSGSTGRPKGVMVEHRNVLNFFAGMDQRIGEEEPGTWLAVTSISFDISVLELFWTLARGFKVIVQGESDRAPSAAEETTARPIDFSLFYFASNEEASDEDKYRLLLEGARFADANGFSAVWTPERHFHAFGGLYPNPSVTSAAIAAITERVRIRAGSVVLPLHSPIRVAEEWAVVDNLSRGRVDLAFASGWHDRDFVFAPENYAGRRDVMFSSIEAVRRLWRGEAIAARTGAGKETEIRTLPRPVQPELPIWITAAGTPETFETAGRIGANLLTHLLGQQIEKLAERIALYRESRRAHGHVGDGCVTLMLHTYLDHDIDAVKRAVWKPFREYLRTSVDLIRQLAEGRGQDIRSADFTADDMEALLDHAFHRYFETSALMGTPESCIQMVERLKAIGVDEIACLIDFGVEQAETMSSLHLLAELRRHVDPQEARRREEFSLARQLERHAVTHMQCTPSMASMLLAQPEARAALGGLRALMIGGEAFPGALAAELNSVTAARLINMYGPTETTIWSSTHEVDGERGTVPIGRPIANTALHVLDRNLRALPVGVPGELCIGGEGVVRGYLRRPELTAERFVPDPFVGGAARLYRTGDLVRRRADGIIEFLGRTDHQVKIRGHRIELGEIEALLAHRVGVREAVVVAREDVAGDKRLVAYVVLEPDAGASPADLRDALREALPEYMVPSHVVRLETLPRTPNLKVDRKALPAPEHEATAPAVREASPASELESRIAAIWQDVLRVPQVGVEDNFFDIGGHSLLTIRVHAHLRATIDPGISITDLFRFPTVRALARHLGGTTDGMLAGEGRERADARRQAMGRRRQRRGSDAPVDVQGSVR